MIKFMLLAVLSLIVSGCAGINNLGQSHGSALTTDSASRTCETYKVCDGSIQTDNNGKQYCNGKCMLPKSFDWRNRHGKNRNSEVKNQGQVPACVTFGNISVLEAGINLYFNQLLNIDLSEQIMISCANTIYRTVNTTQQLINGTIFEIPVTTSRETPAGHILDPNIDPIDPMAIFTASKGTPAGKCYNLDALGMDFCKAKEVGITDQSCMSNQMVMSTGYYQCNGYCTNYQTRVRKIQGFGTLVPAAALAPSYGSFYQYNEILNENILKEKIITNGPVSIATPGTSTTIIGFILGHGVAIVGWYEENGRTIRIYKNSRTNGWGDGGYGTGYTTVPIEDAGVKIGFIKYPIISPPATTTSLTNSRGNTNNQYKIICSNADNDNYCYRGIGNQSKPSNCPSSCNSTYKDRDDSNNQIGMLGSY